mmetsp:Transcript_38300/g.83228  ORF Transcript_38300/g.83228 Transcript_38300/m.83228 type:complete len:214 (-) Transcript_38300:36-677(-)
MYLLLPSSKGMSTSSTVGLRARRFVESGLLVIDVWHFRISNGRSSSSCCCCFLLLRRLGIHRLCRGHFCIATTTSTSSTLAPIGTRTCIHLLLAALHSLILVVVVGVDNSMIVLLRGYSRGCGRGRAGGSSGSSSRRRRSGGVIPLDEPSLDADASVGQGFATVVPDLLLPDPATSLGLEAGNDGGPFGGGVDPDAAVFVVHLLVLSERMGQG